MKTETTLTETLITTILATITLILAIVGFIYDLTWVCGFADGLVIANLCWILSTHYEIKRNIKIELEMRKNSHVDLGDEWFLEPIEIIDTITLDYIKDILKNRKASLKPVKGEEINGKHKFILTIRYFEWEVWEGNCENIVYLLSQEDLDYIYNED